jgi:hypothetical protein
MASAATADLQDAPSPDPNALHRDPGEGTGPRQLEVAPAVLGKAPARGSSPAVVAGASGRWAAARGHRATTATTSTAATARLAARKTTPNRWYHGGLGTSTTALPPFAAPLSGSMQPDLPGRRRANRRTRSLPPTPQPAAPAWRGPWAHHGPTGAPKPSPTEGTEPGPGSPLARAMPDQADNEVMLNRPNSRRWPGRFRPSGPSGGEQPRQRRSRDARGHHRPSMTRRTDPVMAGGALAGVSSRIRVFGGQWTVG